jgi:hypothetical protein
MAHATFGRLAAACFILALAPLASANETQAPVVSKRHVSPSETQTLNPQPIPPGKSPTATKTPKPGQEQSIIFVGGKKVASAKPNANDSTPSPGKSKVSTKPRTPSGQPT